MSECRTNTAVVGCFVPAAVATPPEGIVIHYVYDVDGVRIATLYSNAAGDPIDITTYLGGGVVTPGACPAIEYDFETVLLCDDVDGDPVTPPIPFLRKIERWTNAGTGVLINQVVTNTALDGVTAYVVADEANVSSNCQLDWEFVEVIVCDATGATFVRRQTQINGEFVTLGYFDLAGAAATPVAPVGACPNCQPEADLGVITSWALLR